MKTINIILHKDKLYKKIESVTWKRADATLSERPEREQAATSADTDDEAVDAMLVEDYCLRRDARIRARLKFCLIDETGSEMTYDNDLAGDDRFEYKLKLDDDVTKSDVQSIGTLLDEYVVRGATYDWYMRMGYQPTDSEQSLQELEDSLAYMVRGKAWGYKPLSPFGPAKYDYNKMF